MAEQRLIDADRLQNIIYKFYCRWCRETGCDRCRGCKVYNILGFIKKLCGTVEAKPVVHAHWEGSRCSNCKRNLFELFDAGSHLIENFKEEVVCCPYCGAQMDEGVKIPVISIGDVPKIMEEMEK